MYLFAKKSSAQISEWHAKVLGYCKDIEVELQNARCGMCSYYM